MLRWCRRRRRFLALGLGGTLFCMALFLVLAVLHQATLSIINHHHTVIKKSPHQLTLFFPLATWEEEYQRLAGFFDQVTLLCRAAKAVPVEGLGSVPVCTESRAVTLPKHNWTVISLESQNFDFEQNLSAIQPSSQVYILTTMPQKKKMQPQLNVVPVTSNDTVSWLREIRTILNQTGKDTVDILKLGTVGSESVNPSFVQSLLDSSLLDAVQQIHIVVQLNGTKSQIFEWYKVLSWAKLRLRWSPFHVISSDSCSKPSDLTDLSCIYFSSWLPEPEDDGLILPKIKGSDQEQAATVLSLLTANEAQCPQLLLNPVRPSSASSDSNIPSYMRPKQWPLCASHLTKNCTAYSAKYGGDFAFQRLLTEHGCQVYIFDPSGSTEAVPVSKKIIHYPWGFESMRTLIQFSVNDQLQIWDLRKPSEVIHDLGHDNQTIDILHLDVNAGEWDVFNEMINSKTMQRVRQVVATIHVWFGEEYYNLINQFVALRQMSQMGLEVYFSEPLLDLSYSNHLGYAPSNVTPGNTSQCCYVVGWIKKDMQVQ